MHDIMHTPHNTSNHVAYALAQCSSGVSIECTHHTAPTSPSNCYPPHCACCNPGWSNTLVISSMGVPWNFWRYFILKTSLGLTGQFCRWRYSATRVGLAPVNNMDCAFSSNCPVGCRLPGYRLNVSWSTAWLWSSDNCLMMNFYKTMH